VGVFEAWKPQAYPYVYAAEFRIPIINGGTPTDPNVAEGWLKSKLGIDKDDLIREAAAEIMAERGVTADVAIETVSENRHLNGFKRQRCSQCPPEGVSKCSAGPHVLYIEGRYVKAGIKEAGNIRWPNGRWSFDKDGKVRLLIKSGTERTSGKVTKSFLAEHVSVQESIIPLGVTEPTGINQRFVHPWRGSGIQYEEYVEDVKISFNVATDVKFTDEQWALLWLTGQEQGIGASRSQGYGRYEVIRWELM